MASEYLKLPDGSTAIMLTGGPTRKISVNHCIWNFEDSYYCPTVIDEDNNQMEAPDAVYHAMFQWDRQGKQIDSDGLCVWYHEPKSITKKIGPRTCIVIGHEPPVKGE